MAAEDSITVEFDKQELDDTICCCICTNVYTDPKALPCIHTFCMKCLQQIGLKTEKGRGDEMPCPICRRHFTIPQEGFCALPNNFFIAKLIQVANVSDPFATPTPLCDACLEDNDKEGKDKPKADLYCIECKQNLCEECCRHHRKLKLTKSHKLMLINEQQESDENVMANLAPSVCEIHEQRVVEIYCDECKTVECAVCFIDGHKHHEGSHVSKLVDVFRKQIETNIETINHCSSQAQMKKEELIKIKEDMQQRVERLEMDVMKRRDELKQCVDAHANSLLQSLCSVRQSKLKEIQMEADDIDAHLPCLQSYSSYCQKIMAKGSAIDVCRAVSDLSVRAIELQQQCQSLIEREIQPFTFNFMKSKFKDFLEDNSLIEENLDCGMKILDLEQKLEQERNAWIEEREQLINQIQEQHRIIAELRYKLDPVLVQTIRTKATEEKKSINGLTILDKELFVARERCSEVEVYDSMKFSFSRRWNLKELIDPEDIGSCDKGLNKCLYIFDYKGSYGQSKEILRVDQSGKLITSWSTGNDYGRLSVTDESNVILTVFNKNKLNEYSSDGQLIREINLSSDSGISNPMHAIKLANGHFVVSHGVNGDDLHRVCVLDGDGKLKKSFGGNCGSAIRQMACPVYLAVDGNGFVMVADRLNSRVLLLDSDLEILSKENHGLRRPQRILLDESNGRLFVADNEWDSQKKIYKDGRILVFEFR